MPSTFPFQELVASSDSPCGRTMSTFVRFGCFAHGPTANSDSGAGCEVS